MTELDAFHKTVRDVAREVLIDRQSALNDRGLRSRVELRRQFSDERESSELCIEFWRENALVDLFEDFVVRDGCPVATSDELRRWLEENVDAVLREQDGA